MAVRDTLGGRWLEVVVLGTAMLNMIRSFMDTMITLRKSQELFAFLVATTTIDSESFKTASLTVPLAPFIELMNFAMAVVLIGAVIQGDWKCMLIWIFWTAGKILLSLPPGDQPNKDARLQSYFVALCNLAFIILVFLYLVKTWHTPQLSSAGDVDTEIGLAPSTDNPPSYDEAMQVYTISGDSILRAPWKEEEPSACTSSEINVRS